MDPPPRSPAASDAPPSWRRPLHELQVSLPDAQRLLRRAAPLVGLAAFALATWLLWRELSGHSYAALTAAVREVPGSALAWALGLTLAGYAMRSAHDLLALRYVRRRLPLRTVATASFLANALSNNLGNTLVTGAAARYWVYASAGLSAAENLRIVLFCGIGAGLGWMGMAALAWAATPGWRVAGGGLALGLLAYLVLSASRRRWSLGGWRLQLPSPILGLGQVVVGMVELLFMAATLYALLPEAVPPGRFLAVFALAVAAGAASHVPGGLGVFEGVVMLLLGERIAAPGLAAALLLFRAIYLVLPLLLASLWMALRVARWQRLRGLARALPALAPNLLAGATFVAGAMLLFSGALPAPAGRLQALDRWVVLPVIESSHLAASLAGVVLLVVARGLQRRLDAAWWCASTVLGAALVFSLGKGAAPWELLVPALVLAALLPLRSQFYRRSRLLAEPLSPAWLAALAVVMGAAVWLLRLGHSDAALSGQAWWAFALDAEAARSLRAAVGSVALALAVGLHRLLAPPPPRAVPADAQAIERARPIVEASPFTYAHLALRGDKALLFSDTGHSFLMYDCHGRTCVAMGDPVGDEPGSRELAWRFREMCDRAGMWCAFFEVGPQRRDFYASLGLGLTCVGSEARVDLQAFRLEEPAHKGLRHERARLARQGCSVEVVPREAVPPLMPQLREVSDAWLATKPTREKGFSTASFDPAYLCRFPVVLVRRGPQVLAFANLWLGADRHELSVDLMRHLPQAPHGTMDLLFSELMLWGRAQGFRWFNFGMAPLHGIGESGDAQLWVRTARLLYRHGRRFYDFEGLQRYKHKFKPVWTPLYLACPGGLALPAVLLDVAAVVAGGVGGLAPRPRRRRARR